MLVGIDVASLSNHDQTCPSFGTNFALQIDMSKTPMSERSLPPVLLLSHGTPMLAGEQSHIRDYWNHQGDEALRYGIKGVVIMVSEVRVESGTIDTHSTWCRAPTGASQDMKSALPPILRRTRSRSRSSKGQITMDTNPIQTFLQQNDASNSSVRRDSRLHLTPTSTG